VYDVREAWRQVQSGTNAVSAARSSIDAAWSNSTELSQLFAYVGARANSSRPLALAGIDPQFTGPIGGGTSAQFLNALDAYLDRYDSPVRRGSNWPAFRSVVDRLARRYYDAAPFTDAERATFAAGAEQLMSESNRLVNVAPSDEASFWVTMSLALNAHGRSVALRQQNQHELAAGIRDSSLSNSLVWLAQTVYPGRKLIVWSTATQVMRTPNELYGAGGLAQGHGRAIFGQIARVTLGDVMYSLGFLAGSGTYGPLDTPATTPVRPLVLPLPESWDGLFLATGKPLAFLHLRRTATQENAWIFGRRVARAIGYQQFAANWPAVYDGFFFTASMSPATRAP
jgi:erythromycin esterase